MMFNALLLLAVSLAWASNYLLIGNAEDSLAPLTMSAMMIGSAAVVLLVTVPLVFRRPLWQPFKDNAGLITLMSFTAISLPNLSVVFAEQNITSDMAAVVGTTVPVFTCLIAIFIARSLAPTFSRALGVVVAVSGVVTYMGWGNILSDTSQGTGILIMMSGGLIFAVNGFLTASKAAHIDRYSLTTLVLTLSALLFAVLAFIFERHLFQMPNNNTLLSLGLAGVVGNGLAYLVYFVLLGRSGAYFTSMYAYLVPIFGVILGFVFLDESLTLDHVMGLLVVLSGLWLLMRKTAAVVPDEEST